MGIFDNVVAVTVSLPSWSTNVGVTFKLIGISVSSWPQAAGASNEIGSITASTRTCVVSVSSPIRMLMSIGCVPETCSSGIKDSPFAMAS